MNRYKNGIALGQPPTLEKQLEVLRAARTLLAQERDDADRRRCDEIAALRHRAVHLAVQQAEELRRELDPRLRSRVIRYNADEPRVPRGDHGGGEWTSGGGVPARAPERGPQYAQASTGTVTDAANGGGNAPAAAVTQQYPYSFPHELFNVTVDLYRDKVRHEQRDFIWSYQIPADSPKRPEWLVDNFGQPILDARGNQLVGPHDLPPEAYVQAGLAAKSGDLADKMHELAEDIQELTQAVRGGGNTTLFSEEDSRSVGILMAMVAYEILPFVHAGSFDAERFDNFYVRDYRPYTSVALGIFMAAAGVSREDMLTIADFYAGVFSNFREDMDPNYPHSTKQDIQDNLLGYDLYESGRIGRKN